MTTLSELHAQLDHLETALPQLLADHPEEGDFWSAFAGLADVTEDAAGEHCHAVHTRIDEMLAKHGLGQGHDQ